MNIFKVRDEVYHHNCGWATVKEIKNDMCFLHDVNNTVVCFPCSYLSFTEYTLQGFSQDRLIELPEVGEVCLFSDFEVTWCIGEFNGYGSLDYPFGTFDLGDFKYCKRVKFL